MLPSAKHRVFISKLTEHIGKEVTIAGYIASKRDHGKVLFLDIRDVTGNIQSVSTHDQTFFTSAQEAKEQSAVIVKGTVSERPEKLKTDAPNGAIELQITDIAIVTPAKDIPWAGQDSKDVNEETRMRYRYLDLRNPKMQENLKLRSRVTHFIRSYLHEQSFTEIETPYLTKSTPEGAREYLVPARQQPGHFYALAQSPQQFKQLLMVAGFDRYFSIARCFRDEDPRGDRQPEFTQLDLEMSFVDQEDILELIETMYIAMVKELTPEKKFTTLPFPRLTFAESMEKYGTDKPDLRQDKNDPNELAFCWIVDVPMFEYSESEKKLVASHHLFTRPKPGDEALLETEPLKALSSSYDFVLNGYEIGGGSIRIHERALQEKIFRILGISEAHANKLFGHMLEAFQYGVPPHGGIAPGIDRFVMLLAGEPSLREVIAFPKTGDGRDLMMESPSTVNESQLQELHIRVHDTKK